MFVGDLIPRHKQIFSTNQFFHGLVLPEPDTRVSGHIAGLLPCISI